MFSVWRDKVLSKPSEKYPLLKYIYLRRVVRLYYLFTQNRALPTKKEYIRTPLSEHMYCAADTGRPAKKQGTTELPVASIVQR